jgi:adenylate kinase
MNEIKKKIPSAKIVNMGDLIFKLAKKKLGIKNRDEMRGKLSPDQQRGYQDLTAKQVAKMKNKILIIDTHITINTPHGYFPGLSEDTVHILRPDIIVLLEFRPEDVIERRKNDAGRKRDSETKEEIELHQTYNREFAIAAAGHVDASVEIINLRYPQKKKFDHAKKAASEIVKLIKE